MLRSRASRRRHWLITRYDSGSVEILTIYRGGGEEVLPVFSFEEEAELFLRYQVPDSGWTVRESTAGELASVLYGLCSGVGAVALDPLPEIVSRGAIELVSVSREDFLDSLLGKKRLSGACRKEYYALVHS